ncbi:MAG: inorganic diphosphatase [Myxococcales bacterium]|nr:inorganic diphosphatase [Myxococcales bacterium]
MRVVIEIPSGSRNKLEYRDGGFVLDRVLPEHVGGYPVNYGFLPCTRAPDGDPLDVLLPGKALATGTELDVRIVGLLRMIDEKGEDPKLLAAPPDERHGPTRLGNRSPRSSLATSRTSQARTLGCWAGETPRKHIASWTRSPSRARGARRLACLNPTDTSTPRPGRLLRGSRSRSHPEIS